jgi:hypothetical protein
VDESAVAKTLHRMNEGLAGLFWDAFTAVAVNGISADYVEFGSWGCNTLRHAYQTGEQFQAKRHLWGRICRSRPGSAARCSHWCRSC